MTSLSAYKQQNPLRQSKPKQNLLQKAGNFVGGVAKDALNTLVVTPATRIAQAGLAVAEPFMKPETRARVEASFQKPQTNFGVTVPPQKAGLAGVEQIGGQALKAGSYLYGGQGLGALGETAGIGARALQGAKVGAIAGATGGAGQSMEQGGNLGQVAGGALEGGLIGAGTGGIIGGATAAIHPIFSRSTPIMKPTEISFAQQGVEEATQGLKTAQEARANVSQPAVEGAQKINQGVQEDLTRMGQEFEQGAKKLDSTNPTTKLTLSNKQLDALNSLKEGKNFALPENLDQEANPLMGTQMGKAFLDKNAGKFADLQNATKTELTASQTQDLIHRLNKLTFDAKASGDLSVNQQTIGLRNELKASASKTFGPEWDKVYSKYHEGRAVMEKLDKIANLDPNASPNDLNAQIENIKKLSNTPEGKILLEQSLESYKQERGIDFTDPMQSIQQILEKDQIVESAQGKLKEAQKGLTQAQREAAKPNILQKTLNPVYLAHLGLRLAAAATLGVWLRNQFKNIVK